MTTAALVSSFDVKPQDTSLRVDGSRTGGSSQALDTEFSLLQEDLSDWNITVTGNIRASNYTPIKMLNTHTHTQIRAGQVPCRHISGSEMVGKALQLLTPSFPAHRMDQRIPNLQGSCV